MSNHDAFMREEAMKAAGINEVVETSRDWFGAQIPNARSLDDRRISRWSTQESPADYSLNGRASTARPCGIDGLAT